MLYIPINCRDDKNGANRKHPVFVHISGHWFCLSPAFLSFRQMNFASSGTLHAFVLTSVPVLFLHFQIKSCDTCQRSGNLKTAGNKLHPIVTEKPWQVFFPHIIQYK